MTSLLQTFGSNSTIASFTQQTYQKLAESPSLQTISTEAGKRLSGLKPWTDFFAFSRLHKPTDYSSFRSRFDFNVLYFQNNYLLISLLVVGWFLISDLKILLGAILAVAGFKAIQALPSNQPTVLFGTSFLPAQLWVVYGITFFFWFWMSGVTGNLLYSVGFIAVLVAAHAGSLDKPVEAEFASESEFLETV